MELRRKRRDVGDVHVRSHITGKSRYGGGYGHGIRPHNLVNDSADEHTLVRLAIKISPTAIVIVAMAAATKKSGGGPIERLLTSRELKSGVVRIRHGDRKVDRDAAYLIDDCPEPVHVDLGVMGDAHACKLGDDLRRVRGAANGVGCVDLLVAI